MLFSRWRAKSARVRHLWNFQRLSLSLSQTGSQTKSLTKSTPWPSFRLPLQLSSLIDGLRRAMGELPPATPVPQNVGTVFVTVGTTRFDALVSSVVSDSSLATLSSMGVTRLIVQHGHGPAPDAGAQKRCAASGVKLESFDFVPGIGDLLSKAGLVLSHGGAGSLLEALALRRRVVAVVNRTLMHDHQRELAAALHSGRHLVATDVSGLTAAMPAAARAEFVPWPERDHSLVASVVAQELCEL